MLSNKVHVQPLPARKLVASDWNADQPASTGLISTVGSQLVESFSAQPGLAVSEGASTVPKEATPFNISEWDGSRLQFFGLTIPFADALLLFGSMLGSILSYFKFLAVAVGRRNLPGAVVLVLYIGSVGTFYT